MARPKSGEKHNAILSAATAVFAEQGLGAATSAISRAASVAEGTLFTYFKTKDDLLNALYRSIKLELADAMMSGFPRKQSVRVRLRHVWESYVNWGVENPVHRRVLAQLEVSNLLTPESKATGAAPFLEMRTLVDDAAAQHLLQRLPEELIAAAMRSLAEATMDLIAANPEMADQYRESAFKIFWSGIMKQK